jgi:hypothetical protein
MKLIETLEVQASTLLHMTRCEDACKRARDALCFDELRPVNVIYVLKQIGHMKDAIQECHALLTKYRDALVDEQRKEEARHRIAGKPYSNDEVLPVS